MSNKLKDVFSKKMFEMGLNLQFRDVESKAEFEKAMAPVSIKISLLVWPFLK